MVFFPGEVVGWALSSAALWLLDLCLNLNLAFRFCVPREVLSLFY
jgi:hypothetical protein